MRRSSENRCRLRVRDLVWGLKLFIIANVRVGVGVGVGETV